MGMNNTPSGERTHISFFGKRNAGKSSVVNAVTGQELCIVSDVKGTTTDPVKKTMELLPLGPVVIIDTPGFDDEGLLGEKRVLKTYQVLNRTDIAVLVVDATIGISSQDQALIDLFNKKQLPFAIVYNKSDLLNSIPDAKENEIYVSALNNTAIFELKELLAGLKPGETSKTLLGNTISAGDTIILVIPIDKAAPKGRLILPQQQTIRDILDHNANAIMIKEDQLEACINMLNCPPKLVITDSQVFGSVMKKVPTGILVTSFSILMANYKGFLYNAVAGVSALNNLKEGATILIAEGCTHHRQCDDIGTYKLPKWIREYTGKDFYFETCSGNDFPLELNKYDFILHCGGCMLNEKEMQYRSNYASDNSIPFTNYGILIAYINGILKRSLEIFPEIHELV